MKEILNKKTIFSFILGILLSATTVYGSTLIQSNTVGYDNRNSGFKDSDGNDVTDVKTAIDELYILANHYDECEDGYTRENIDDTKYRCISNEVLEVKAITLEVGDIVKMTPTVSSYTTDTTKTGYSSTQTINPQELNLWRVIRVNNNNGTITYDAVSEYLSSVDIYFGQTGTSDEAKTGGVNAYKNYIGYLNTLASQYENSDYTVGSRYLGYNGQTEIISDTSYFDGSGTLANIVWSTSTSGTPDGENKGRGDSLYVTDYNLVKQAYGGTDASAVAYKINNKETASEYWLASRYYNRSSLASFGFAGSTINTSGTVSRYAFRSYSLGWSNNSYAYAIRPIITLKSSLQASGFGTNKYPYILQ